MMQLLSTVILCQMALLLSLLFKTPFKKLSMVAVDRLKQETNPVISLTLVGFLFSVLVSSIYSMTKIHHRSIAAGSIDLTDQVLMANKTLIASLTGFSLFFTMLIRRLHRVVTKRSSLKRIIKVEEKRLAEMESQTAERRKVLEKEIATLKTAIKKLEFECEKKANQAKTAEANVMALRRQFEELKLEYDHNLEYNQTLQNQLLSIDQNLLEDNEQRGQISFKSDFICEGRVQFPWSIQTSGKGSGEHGSDIDVERTNESVQCLCNVGRVISSPRHRRPIYQH